MNLAKNSSCSWHKMSRSWQRSKASSTRCRPSGSDAEGIEIAVVDRGKTDPPTVDGKRSLRDGNVYLRELDGGEEFPLTEDASEEFFYRSDFQWSPDSSRLVAMRTKKGDDRKVYFVESSPKDQLQPKLQSYDYRKPGDRIPQDKPVLFDVAERKKIAISDDLFPTRGASIGSAGPTIRRISRSSTTSAATRSCE